MRFDLDFTKTLRSGARRFELGVRLRSDSQRLVLLGPSGSGKSLTLKAIAGLLRPDSGHVRLCGRTLFDRRAGIDVAPRDRALGYLFQDYALFPHLSVRQNVAFGLQRGWLNPARASRSERLERWLAALELQEIAQLMPHQLSGGQRQRTALARALVAEPGALLLDEPFAALDPALRARMREELAALQRRLQLPMVLITHDMQDAQALGDEVFELAEGRIIAPP